MDRSMKVMFGMMTIAICLLAITMMNNQSQQAYAGEYVGGGDRGTELTIVSFRVTPLLGVGRNSGGQGTDTNVYGLILTRMWSDGTVEVNFVGEETIPDLYEQDGSHGYVIGQFLENQPWSGWKTVTDSVAGYACVGDTDGNREVNVTDLLAVFNNWGECEQDPPINIPPDQDLM